MAMTGKPAFEWYLLTRDWNKTAHSIARIRQVYTQAASGLATGHKNAVVEVHWTSDGERIVSASADKSVSASPELYGLLHAVQ